MDNKIKKRPEVIINKNGPIKVTAPFDLVGADGNPITPESVNEVYLCACGQSSNKPFCDGSHNSKSSTL
ncbi:MAG: CDGSH iron-sulfur domain-containing protein [Bacteroidales bacterium]